MFVAALLFCQLSIMAGSFALLPQTRTQAKVRWSHIARILLYSMAFVVIVGWMHVGVQVLGATDVIDLAILPHWTFIFFIVPLGVAGYWGSACHRYLELPRPWFIAAMLTVVSTLMIAAFAFYGLPAEYERFVFPWGI